MGDAGPRLGHHPRVRGPDEVDDLELLSRWQAGQTSAGRELVRASDPMEHSVVDPATAGSVPSLLASAR